MECPGHHGENRSVEKCLAITCPVTIGRYFIRFLQWVAAFSRTSAALELFVKTLLDPGLHNHMNDNSLSTPPKTARPPAETALSERRTGRLVVRVLTWVLIAGLGGLAANEFWARVSYNGAVAILQDLNLETVEDGVPRAELEARFSGWRRHEVAENGDHVYHWVGLRRYEITLIPGLNKSDQISSFATADAGETVEEGGFPDEIPPMPKHGPMAAPLVGPGRGVSPPPPPGSGAASQKLELPPDKAVKKPAEDTEPGRKPKTD